MNDIIQLSNVKKSYGQQLAIRGVNLTLKEGEVRVLIGPSGCGKSTLLRCVNLLEIPDSGSVRIRTSKFEFSNGQHRYPAQAIADFRSRIGMVFQLFDLFPHMTIMENVMSGPVIVKRMPKPEARELAGSLLDKVGLSEVMNSYPRDVSGGQAQRAAIARALAMDPEVLLFDEATSALDPELVEEVLKVMNRLVVEGKTMIIVTHEMRFAQDVAHRVTFMDRGQIVEEGSAQEIFEHPQMDRTISFLNRFRARN